MKQIRCSVSRVELDAALKFSGLCITGEGENMKIMKVPEGVREIPVPEGVREIPVPEIDLGDVHIPRKHTLTPAQQLIEAEAKLSRLESKVLALEDDIAWLVDAMRRIGEQIKRGAGIDVDRT